MFTALIILALIASALLVLMVLIQNPKGGGLSSQFTGAGSQQLFGVKRTGDLLEQLTWGFAAALAAFCLATIFFFTPAGTGGTLDDGLGTAAPAPTVPAPRTLPAGPAPAQPQQAPATAPQPQNK